MYLHVDIYIRCAHVRDYGCDIFYVNGRQDLAFVQPFCSEDIKKALFDMGYIQDYNETQVREDIPVLVFDAADYMWQDFNHYLQQNLDHDLAKALVLHCLNDQECPKA